IDGVTVRAAVDGLPADAELVLSRRRPGGRYARLCGSASATVEHELTGDAGSSCELAAWVHAGDHDGPSALQTGIFGPALTRAVGVLADQAGELRVDWELPQAVQRAQAAVDITMRVDGEPPLAPLRVDASLGTWTQRAPARGKRVEISLRAVWQIDGREHE